MIIWKPVTCQRITSKKYSTSMGWHLSPRYGQEILVSGYLVSTAVNWSQHWCEISFLLGSLVRRYESKHWFFCGADVWRSVGRCTVTWLPNFLGWVDLLSYGAPPTRAQEALLWIVCGNMCELVACKILFLLLFNEDQIHVKAHEKPHLKCMWTYVSI